jgi:hypothetical protein
MGINLRLWCRHGSELVNRTRRNLKMYKLAIAIGCFCLFGLSPACSPSGGPDSGGSGVGFGGGSGPGFGGGSPGLNLEFDLASSSALLSAGGSFASGDTAGALTFSQTQEESAEGSTNLLALDENGDASVAVTTNGTLLSMYTVTDPAAQYVYIALEWDFWSAGEPTHSQEEMDSAMSLIAQLNCGLLRISLADNSYECVQEGFVVQSMNDQYMQTISGNSKPMQFDAQGNLFYAATAFERVGGETHTECCDENDEEFLIEEPYWLNGINWQPRIYRYNTASKENTALTQDNEFVNFFRVLKSGEVAYQVNNEGDGAADLKMWQDGQTIVLTDQSWGVSFFTGDDATSVIWGDWNNANKGMYFARPRPNGTGVEKTLLNTSLFGVSRDGQQPQLRRVLVADNGKLYGVFESYIWDEQEKENLLRLSVYQVLPFAATPIIQLELPDTGGWWSLFEATPFQISNGYLYYTSSENVPFLGARDEIVMVNLETREEHRLLNEDGQRFQLYTWRLLENGTLFFAGQDLTASTTVSGEINTQGVVANPNSTDNLQIATMTSASRVIKDIKDIESLDAKPVATNPNVAPTVTSSVNPENIYSASLEFSTRMKRDHIESGIKLKKVNGQNREDVATFPVYINNSLHLIPDLSDSAESALGDANAKPLDASTAYEIVFEGDIEDDFGNAMASKVPVPLNTRPDAGLYLGEAPGDVASFAAGKVCKFAGSATRENDWDYARDVYAPQFGGSLPENLQLDFSAKSLGWEGVHILLRSEDDTYEVNCQPRTQANCSAAADITACGNAIGCQWDAGTASCEYTSGWGEVCWEHAQQFDKAGCEAASQCSYTQGGETLWRARAVSLRLGSWSNVEYAKTGTEQSWKDGSTGALFHGGWQKIRVQFFDTQIKVFFSNDGSVYEEVSRLTVDDPDLRSRSGADLKLYLAFSNAMVLDNLEITALDSAGNADNTQGVAGIVHAQTFDETLDSDALQTYFGSATDGSSIEWQ